MMSNEEIKLYIAQQTREGFSLSKIQDMLTAQGVKLSFMELRLLAAEIDTEFWTTLDREKESKNKKSENTNAVPQQPKEQFPQDDMRNDFGQDVMEEEIPSPDETATQAVSDDDKPQNQLRGKTVASLSPIQRPGFLATGTVQFGSGASGEWCLDQLGRVSFDSLNGHPDKQDFQEFQMELQRLFSA